MTYNEALAKLKSESVASPAGNGVGNTPNADNKTEAPEQNIWSHILQEVQNSTKKMPPSKSLILLGDNESGRSTLISRIKGVENISKGIGLEYHYIEINNEEDRDDTQKLGVWIPDGDGACTGLLKFALNENNFEHTMVAFVVSMSTPWTIMDSLKKWSAILTDHVKKLNIPVAKRNEYLKQQCRLFQSYRDPDESHQILLNTSAKKSNPGTPVSSLRNVAPAEVETVNDTDDMLLPLDPAILNKNLGISVMVIVTKSDSISVLDKENEYRIEHFDFIQYHIRRFCLDYGASIFYTTIKDKRTYDKLYKYLAHRLYNFSFNIPSCVVDRESVFIPTGWDNEGKINILLENSTTIKSDSEYSDIIPRPSLRKPAQRDVETVIAVEDQDFLSKLQLVLNKASTPSVKQEDMNLSQSMNASNTTPQTLKTPHKPVVQVLKGANPNAPDSTNLKNFFQNLLNKNAPSNASLAPTAPTNQESSSSTASSQSNSNNNASSESNA